VIGDRHRSQEDWPVRGEAEWIPCNTLFCWQILDRALLS
jgi:hypothetical protein